MFILKDFSLAEFLTEETVVNNAQLFGTIIVICDQEQDICRIIFFHYEILSVICLVISNLHIFVA